MMEQTDSEARSFFLPHVDLQQLIDVLLSDGYQVVGPTVSDAAIKFECIAHVRQLPQGIRDHQSPGQYRLEQTAATHFFAWANGPQALKPWTFRPQETLWQAVRNEEGALQFKEIIPEPIPIAVLGARACDIAALHIHDRVFIENEYQDEHYQQRRNKLFLIAVDCNYPADTCFCVSTHHGPKVSTGFDLVLTELTSGFIIRAGSVAGERILASLQLSEATDAQHYEAGNLALQAEHAQKKQVDLEHVKAHLFSSFDNARWDEIAERCLSCGNCTMVCPTCFCHSESDVSNLQGTEVDHVRQWDSCFTQGHSYIHGMTVRKETKLRYRQWLTHKFSSWHEQFSSSGCVGCGRCVTWCPSAIDITEELAALCPKESI